MNNPQVQVRLFVQTQISQRRSPRIDIGLPWDRQMDEVDRMRETLGDFVDEPDQVRGVAHFDLALALVVAIAKVEAELDIVRNRDGVRLHAFQDAPHTSSNHGSTSG